MKHSQRIEKENLIKRYTEQPDALPRHIRTAMEVAVGNEPVQLYALSDLDGRLKLTQQWVGITPSYVVTAPNEDEVSRGDVRKVLRSSIQRIRTEPGLSFTQMQLLAEPDQPALEIIRYSHRQRRAMENLQFVLEQAIEGNPVSEDKLGKADDRYQESLTKPIQEAQASVFVNDMTIIWRLLSYVKPYKKEVMIGVAAAVVVTGMGLIPPYLTGYLIDHVLRPLHAGILSTAEAGALAWPIVGAVAVVYGISQLAGFIRIRLMSFMGEMVARDLRSELYNHLQTPSLSYFSKKRTGGLISRVSSDTDRLWQFIALGAVDVSLAMISLAGLSIILMVLDWKLGLLLVAPLPILFFWIYKHGESMHRIFLRVWRKWSSMTDVLSDTIPGMKVVKAFNREEREKNRFGERNETLLTEFNRIHGVWTSFWPSLMFVVHIFIVLVWAVALYRILGGPGNALGELTVGTFISFLLYAGMFFYPINVIGQMTFILNRATSSAHRIFEVLDTRPELKEADKPEALNTIKGTVQFENVSFAYDGVRQVLRDVSFQAQPGEMIGLVGPSGAGKSTIINMLARFYDPTAGRILVDGKDLRCVETGEYRQQLGMVLQDPYLFHGTVLENIRYGKLDASMKEIVNAAKAANAHDYICKLPHGYDTIVGERGHTLSGGERQRLSIARAILGNPRILILDEATSSVDTETERKIQEALDRLVTGRTVFAIAHRLSTLKAATKLLVIEDGRIAEEGTHAELLEKKDGLYRKLYTMQRELHENYAV